MNNYFPMRPRPLKGESFIGYILRIASSNGYTSLRSICKVLDYKYKAQIFDMSHEQFKNFVTVIAPSLQIDEAHLLTAFQNTQLLDVDEERNIRKIVIECPKICITCLQEDKGHLRHYWQLAHNTYCETHKTKLIHECPNCTKQLDWVPDILEGCNSCGFRWAHYSLIPIKELPMHQVVASRLKNDALKEYLNALYFATTYAAAPHMFISKVVKKFPYLTSETEELLAKGYLLLSDKEGAAKFIQLIKQHMALQLNFYDEKMLTTLIHPISKLPSMCLPLQNKTPCIAIPYDKVGWVSDVQASKLVGITPNELNELSASNIIKQYKIKNVTFYELKHLDEFILELLTNSKEFVFSSKETFLCLAELSKISHKFLFNFAESLALMRTNNISLYRIAETGSLKDVFVKRDSLLTLLKNKEPQQFTHLLSITELEKYFCVNRVKIKEIAALFKWKEIFVNRKSAQYEPKEVADFAKKYILLDKYCDQKIYPKATLVRYLLNHNVYPIDNVGESKAKLDIFKKSKVLSATITQFEKDWINSKAPYKLREYQDKARFNLFNKSANQSFFLTETISTG